MNVIRFVSLASWLLSIPSFAATGPGDLRLSVALESRLDARGEAAEVALTNATEFPQICDRLDVSLAVIRTENDLPAGDIELRFTNIFVRPGETLTEANVGAAALQQQRVGDPTARLFRITPTLGNCRKAEWVDYCGHAALSAGERKTVEALETAFGARDCAELRAEDIFKVALPHAGIADLRPFAYLPNLAVLRLGGNPISSIEPLRTLGKLTQVCVGHTPVAAQGPLTGAFSRNCD